MRPLLLFLLFFCNIALADLLTPALQVEIDHYLTSIETTQQKIKPNSNRLVLMRLRAQRALSQNQYSKAIFYAERTVAYGEYKLSQDWLTLAEISFKYSSVSKDSLYASYLALETAQSDQEKAEALLQIGMWYQENKSLTEALMAFEQSVALYKTDQAVKYMEKLALLKRKDLNIIKNEADVTACLVYEEKLVKETNWQDYIAIKPAIDFSIKAHKENLCINGLAYGEVYDITILAGIAAISGHKTLMPETIQVETKDRPASVQFSDNAYILPLEKSQGILVKSINFSEIPLKVYRLDERNLVKALNEGKLLKQLTGYQLENFETRDASLVWDGILEVNMQKNKTVNTLFPLQKLLPEHKPGIYVVVAEKGNPNAQDSYDSYWMGKPTQWVLISNLAITSLEAENGLFVFARSLNQAKPLENVTINILAKNNEVLASATTGKSGVAHFSAGLLKGQQGKTPVLITATTDKDFNYLNLTRPALDLSDRDIEGRVKGGNQEVYLFTERGVYRPGESVHLVGLLRDVQGQALTDLPLTLRIYRPDGIKQQDIVLKEDKLGAYYYSYDLTPSSRTGLWKALVYLDPNSPAIGQVNFQVEDFLPERIDLKVNSENSIVGLGDDLVLQVNAEYLYGAPASNLDFHADITIKANDKPFKKYQDYHFGLVQEKFQPKHFAELEQITDQQGKATLTSIVESLPDTSLPLVFKVNATIFETGGQATRRILTIPIQLHAVELGIRPYFESGQIAENSMAEFDVIALNAQGNPTDLESISYELYEEDYNYQWYYHNDRWSYKIISREDIIDEGKIILNKGQGKFAYNLSWGDYRLEIYDEKTGAASSYRFSAGWGSSLAKGDSPDNVKLSVENKQYQPGDTAILHFTSPFEGQAEIIIANHNILHYENKTIIKGENSIEIAVTKDWNTGTYVLVSLYRPGDKQHAYQPRRAIGLLHLPIDYQKKTLDIAFTHDSIVLPRQEITVNIQLDKENSGKNYVMLAAVDEGILQLTHFKSPNPIQYFFGKKRLELDIHDIYGRLLSIDDAEMGNIRTGGDGGAGENMQPLQSNTIKPVALFSGIVEVDEKGKASIPLDIPDFNGKLRLMAVALNQNQVGQQESDLIVRDKLVTQASLPRFLAPEDQTEIHVHVHNLDGLEGEYTIGLTTDNKEIISIDDNTKTLSLHSNQQASLSWNVKANQLGNIKLYLDIKGPKEYHLQREWELTIRPAQPYLVTTSGESFKAGHTKFYSTKLLENFYPEKAKATLQFSHVPNVDIAGVLNALSLYAYGCTEQTTSRAMPLLYFDELAETLSIARKGQETIPETIENAIQRILDRQRTNGAFGLWSAADAEDAWLTAYATDFLWQASQKGYYVPSFRLENALEYLQDYTRRSYYPSEIFDDLAYVYYVLAKTGTGDISQVRYFHDNYLGSQKSALAAVQVGAALHFYGDSQRAEQAFRKAFTLLTNYDYYGRYGTPFRDYVAITAILAEINYDKEMLLGLWDTVHDEYQSKAYTSTQEKLWLLLASYRLIHDQPPLTIRFAHELLKGSTIHKVLTPNDLTSPIKARSFNNSAIWQQVTLSGYPNTPLPASENGFAGVKKTFYTLSGKPADLSKVKQGDLLLVLLQGQTTYKRKYQALAVDLIPAGFEIENESLQGKALDDLSWLPSLSYPSYVIARDDRWLAALNIYSSNQSFNLAYLIRATRPGQYQVPPFLVEDMYRPALNARTEMQTVIIVK